MLSPCSALDANGDDSGRRTPSWPRDLARWHRPGAHPRRPVRGNCQLTWANAPPRGTERGVALVTTSNQQPDVLYEQGLQRAQVEPGIEWLWACTEVMERAGVVG